MFSLTCRRTCTARYFRALAATTRCISSASSSSPAQEDTPRKRAPRAKRQVVDDAEPKDAPRKRAPRAKKQDVGEAEPKDTIRKRRPRAKKQDIGEGESEPAKRPGPGPPKEQERNVDKDKHRTRADRFGTREKTVAWGPVSEDLCDSILQQLGPTLSQYKGGNIIDVFPGEGLFSRKLHDLLQPKCHYVIESKHHTNAQDWADKMDELGPSYALSLWEETATYRDIKSKASAAVSEHALWSDVIKHCGELPWLNSSTTAEDVNTNTLLIVNTSRLARGAGTRSKKVSARHATSQTFTRILFEDLLYREGVHKHGVVRCLLWVGQEEKSRFVPRTLRDQSKTTWRSTDAYCAQEVTGHPAYETAGRRTPAHDVRSAWNVAKRMRHDGTELPEHRRSKLHQAVWESVLAAEKDSTTGALGDELEELERLQDALVRGEILRNRPHKEGEDKRRAHPTPEFARLQELQEKFDKMTGLNANQPPITEAVLIAVSALRRLFRYERELRAKYPDGEYLEPQLSGEERDQISRMVVDVENSLNAYSGREKRRMTNIWSYFDDDEALRLQPPTLDWDKRTYEPVACKDEEFDPPYALALIDFQPIPNPAAVKRNLTALSSFTRLITNNAYEKIGHNLETIAHGAGTELIPQCPTILDPAKRGHLNPQYINTRLLTHEMLAELHEAWERWPFRVNDDTLRARVLSGMIHEDV